MAVPMKPVIRILDFHPGVGEGDSGTKIVIDLAASKSRGCRARSIRWGLDSFEGPRRLGHGAEDVMDTIDRVGFMVSDGGCRTHNGRPRQGLNELIFVM